MVSVATDSVQVAASPTVMQGLPIILATLSLIVAAVTLFLTHLRAPKVVVHIGSVVELAYDQQGNADLVLPATFINVSNRTAVVRYAAVTLRRVDGSQPPFFMLWDDFMLYNPETDEMDIGEIAHALALPGKTSVHHVIWFSWFGDLESNLEYREGDYELTLWWWEEPGRPPKHRANLLRISHDELLTLEQHRKARDETLEEIRLERTFAKNMILADSQVENLVQART